MHPALFFKTLDPKSKLTQCLLCKHHCMIAQGKRGLCKTRENHDGTLYTLTYGKIYSENIDPVEKKPLFHLLPGSLSYSICTVGCNFRCKHCQNFDISQYPHLQPGPFPGNNRLPEDIVEDAIRSGCQSISYTYVEPTIFYEFALDTAKLAHKAGIKNIFVSNGYTGEEATREIAPYLTANNIDLKAFTDKFYKEVCGARLQPVLDTIKLMHELGVWLEITTLVIPGWNDSEEELRDIARFIKSISREIPWHVTRFWPMYKMTDREPTPHHTLRRAREIGFEEGLYYIYIGNIPGDDGENTICPGCGRTIIKRTGFTVQENNLQAGRCRFCQTPIAGIF
ncbi:MAG: AmmeMemoRadiSam system radical SAM enzyme [Desulfobulbaceae bacterium]|nr:AmmeMemoRadiSam system radical SAM enzyme [Desulfobulbaceae bacterium]MDH5524272.1 AmmeMemoRadiSam system radical SAM enzyme [Desulfobulbaceae bacterium]